jgi:hypothetical protein
MDRRIRGALAAGALFIGSAGTALGMTEADVTSVLQGGQTLAQLAASKNVEVQTLVDAMVAAERAEIQADVDAGTITQAQADQQIANLTQHETDEVNGVMPARGPGFGGRGHGFNGQSPAGASSGSSTNPTTTSDATSS